MKEEYKPLLLIGLVDEISLQFEGIGAQLGSVSEDLEERSRKDSPSEQIADSIRDLSDLCTQLKDLANTIEGVMADLINNERLEG